MIRAGMVECARVLKPGGFLLVKCMDFVYADGLTLGHRGAGHGHGATWCATT